MIAAVALGFGGVPSSGADDSSVTSTRALNADDCKCISVLPIVPGVKYTVKNSCEPLFVAVQFSGDTLSLSPRIDAMSTWVRLGAVEASGIAQLGNNGWTITSIAAVALRNKKSSVSCSFLTGKSERQAYGEPGDASPDPVPAAPQLNAARDPEPDTPKNPPDELVFTFVNRDPNRVAIRLYSDTRDRVWPSSSEYYFVNGGDTDRKKIRLTCQPGEKVCYGAWRGSDEGAYWGVGSDSRRGCTSCCATCGSGEQDYTLESAGDRSNKFTAIVRSLDTYAVELEFYSTGRNNAWPGGDRMYPLKDSKFHEYTLTCTPGEQICYGGWRSGNSSIYWGAGPGGKKGCENCCGRCGSGSRRWTLNGYNGSSGGSSSDMSSALDFLKGAIELGSAVAGRNVSGGGGGTYTVPRPSGQRPPHRESDVTGTR